MRELAEELAIAVAPVDLVPLTFASHAYDDFHLLMPVFGAYGCAAHSSGPRSVWNDDFHLLMPFVGAPRWAASTSTAQAPGAEHD